MIDIISIASEISKINNVEIIGRIVSVSGVTVEAIGLSGIVSIGSICRIISSDEYNDAEVVSINGDKIKLVPYAGTDNIAVGQKVIFVSLKDNIFPSSSWLGRVIDANCNPLDNKGALLPGEKSYDVKTPPLPAHERRRVEGKLDLGVKSLNCFTPLCKGQRIGIFAGSGVGKSVLMSMITKYAKSDVKVIGLIGERGREVKEFIEDYLGEEGLKSAIIVVATGDESPFMRKKAAYVTLAIAEFFRDMGKEVLCMIDSMTRFAMAQREIGLASNEVPTTKGYTPSVFSELPKLLERAGPGKENQGNITGLFTVLVEGDDTNEPISDSVRGILDGHIILDREIAERGRFPAVNILKSISRTMPRCNNEEENKIIAKAKKLFSTYTDMAELIRIGAYKKGSNEEVDEAIKYYPHIEEFLKQSPDEQYDMEYCYKELGRIIDIETSNDVK